jgi:hypothetical protein
VVVGLDVRAGACDGADTLSYGSLLTSLTNLGGRVAAALALRPPRGSLVGWRISLGVWVINFWRKVVVVVGVVL